MRGPDTPADCVLQEASKKEKEKAKRERAAAKKEKAKKEKVGRGCEIRAIGSLCCHP